MKSLFKISLFFCLAFSCAINQQSNRPQKKSLQELAPPSPLTGEQYVEARIWEEFQQALKKPQEYMLQENCPFIGLPIDKNLYCDYRGYRLYTCCKGCLKIVKKMPYEGLRAMLQKNELPHVLLNKGKK